MSAPFPAWSSTRPMLTKHASTCRITTRVNTLDSLLCVAAGRGFLDDGDEARRLEARAAHEGPVDLGLPDEVGRIVGLDAATVEDTRGLGNLLRRQLGDDP